MGTEGQIANTAADITNVEGMDEITDEITTSVSNSILDSLNINSEVMEKLISFGGKLIIAFIVFALGMIILKLVLRLAKKAMNKNNVEPIIHNYIVICIKAIIMVILIISILSIIGIPTTSLIAVISAAGVAIALALQDSLSNLAGGLLIIINKPFSKGDLIEAQNVIGVVEEIHLMNCKLHTVQNKDIVIPNGILFNGTIVNCSSSGFRRIDISVGVSYDSDLNKVKEVLQKIAVDEPKIMKSPKPSIGVADLADSAIMIDFNVWCETSDYWDVFYGAREAIINEFRKAEIEIPYSQLEVKIKEVD